MYQPANTVLCPSVDGVSFESSRRSGWVFQLAIVMLASCENARMSCVVDTDEPVGLNRRCYPVIVSMSCIVARDSEHAATTNKLRLK